MRSVWVSTRRRAASRRRSECGGEVESAVGPVCVDSLYVEGPGCPLNACVRGAPCSFVPFFCLSDLHHAHADTPRCCATLNSTHCLVRCSAETACSSGLHEAHFTEVHTLLSAEIHTAHTSHAPTQHTPSLSQLHGLGFVDALSLPPPFTNRIGFSQVVLYAVPHPSHSKKKKRRSWSASGLLLVCSLSLSIPASNTQIERRRAPCISSSQWRLR